MKIFSVLLTFIFLCFAHFVQGQVNIRPDSSNFQSKVTIDNVLENNGMKFPLLDGSSGQVLTTDGMGNLTWRDGLTDFSSFYGYACSEPITEYQMSADFFSDTGCGILYDSGGEIGNYANNEFSNFTISSNPDAAYTRVILQSLAIEDNRDTLFIANIAYFIDVNEPDTMVFDGQSSIFVQFESDEVNTEAGFVIKWERFSYQGGNSVNPSMLGFFYNAEKLSVGGGVEQNDAWQNIGMQSVLLGYGGSANGNKSSSVGYANIVSDAFSSAFGYINEATGLNSSAIGDRNKANGSSSSAFGYDNDATAGTSSAFGYRNDALGQKSTAFGYQNVASMMAGSAIGFDNTVPGEQSSAFGYDNATGVFSGASAFGHTNEATALNSSAFGYNNSASSNHANAFGYLNEAEANNASAFGYSNEAQGASSSAFGYNNTAVAANSSALGYQLFVDVYQMAAVGSYNEDPSGSSSSWVSTDPVFMVGNGQSLFSRSTALTILKNGNMGIGINTPSTKLDVLGDEGNLIRMESSTADTWLSFHNTTGYVGYAGVFNSDMDMDFGTGTTNSTGKVHLVSKSVPRLTIDANGDVGIGTTDPSEQLEVDGDVRVGNIIYLGSNERIFDGGANEISIFGKLTPSVDDDDSLGKSGRRWSSVWAVDGTINTSDRKNKTNIKKLDYGLAEILQLKPVRFHWKNREDRGEKLGLVAQDLLDVLPEVVKTHDWVLTSEEPGAAKEKMEVENLGVYYSDIIPVLIHGIQEQQAKIEGLKAEVAVLRAMNERINALEEQLSNQQTILLEDHSGTEEPALHQNEPNPFYEGTRIRFFLPKTTQNAFLVINTVDGKEIKRLKIANTGTGEIIIKSGTYPAGSYSYSLFIDGRLYDTKRMVLVK